MINRLFNKALLLIVLNIAIVRPSPITGTAVSNVEGQINTGTETGAVILSGNETPLLPEGSASSQENETPVLIKGPASFQDGSAPILPILSRRSEQPSQIDGSSSSENNNVTPILIEDFAPSMERIPLLQQDTIPVEIQGSADGVLHDSPRVPTNRLLRSFSPDDMQVLSSFISWIDSNGLGMVESRFGRSVSRTKRSKKYKKADRLKRLAGKFNKHLSKALRRFHWRMNNNNK